MAGRGLRGQWARRGLVALISAGATLVGGELALRHLLFSPNPIAPQLAGRLRQPKDFGRFQGDEVYWQLRARWKKPRQLDLKLDRHDPRFGFLKGSINQQTLMHSDKGLVGERRPVLLFGDSFAQCLTPEIDCFQGLLERSELGRELALINYGVGGFGTDQSFLLMRAVLDAYAAAYPDQNPIVIYSFLLDEDLDRSLLGLREWTKPELSLTSPGLAPLEPALPTARAYLETHAVPVKSWIWRALVHKHGLLPASIAQRLDGSRERWNRLRALHEHLFAELRADLDRRGLEYFVMIFHGRTALAAGTSWEPRESFVTGLFEGLEIPYVTTRTDLRRIGRTVGLRNLFLPPGQPGAGHYSSLGNAAAFEALRRGLVGQFHAAEPEGSAGSPTSWQPPESGLRVTAGRATVEGPTARVLGLADTEPLPERMRGVRARPRSLEGSATIDLELGRGESCEIVWELDGGVRAFSGRPLSQDAEEAASVIVLLSLYADDDLLWSKRIRPGGSGGALDVALVGCRRARLVCEPVEQTATDLQPAHIRIRDVLLR